MLLDEAAGEAQLFKDSRLDFTDAQTLVIKKDLYAFKDGCPVSAYKISNFASTDHLVKIDLPDLPRDENLT